MLQALLIALFGIVFVRGQGPPPPLREMLPAWMIIGCTMAPMVLVVMAQMITARIAGRQMDTRGSLRGLLLYDRITAWGRGVIVVAFGFGVLVLGYLDVIREAVGYDAFMLDVVLALSPPILAIMLGWWAQWPIDRRLREAMLMRNIDEGQPIYPPPSRARFVWTQVRHQLLLVLIPMALLHIWSEGLHRSLEWVVNNRRGWRHDGTTLHTVAHWLFNPDVGPWIIIGVQLAGVIGVLIALPPIMRFAWDTVPMGAGPTRDRLLAMCARQRVRIGQLLVWRTGGLVINGAVLGAVPPLRYILLTDALLDQMSSRSVEAVMAHEVGHIRRRHIPWMLMSMIACAGLVSVVGEVLTIKVMGPLSDDALSTARLVIALVSLAAALLVMGWVSRRFEWQADAFAAAHLSTDGPASVDGSGGPGGSGTVIEEVSPAGAIAMQQALADVARLNHIPVGRFTFRHGSIARRLSNLAGLVGHRVDALPIDRTVTMIKRTIAVAMVALVLLAVFGVTSP